MEKIVEVEKIVEKPVIVEKIIEKPVIVEKENPVEDTPNLDYEISVSVNDLDVKVLRCYGNMTQRRITIEMEIVNKNSNIDKGAVYFNYAYTSDGIECAKLGALSDDSNRAYGVKFPSAVKLKQNYYVLNVSSKISSFSYLEFAIRDAKIVIRNLPVEW